MRVLFLLFIADLLLASEAIGIEGYIASSILFFLIVLLIAINNNSVENKSQKLIRTSNKSLAKLNLRFFQRIKI